MIDLVEMLRSARSLRSAGQVFVLTSFLLIAQLGIATHPLHFDAKQAGQKVELTCSFCVVGSSFGLVPTVPVVHLDRHAYFVADVAIRNVVELQPLATPRLTRGPPFSKI